MTLYGFIFYVLAAFVLATTLMAVISRNPVHAVVYLTGSFFGTAVIFYLLGAPVLAALEVIIYAGAIMVLFLFIVMTLRPATGEPAPNRYRRWRLPIVLGSVSLALSIFFIGSIPRGRSVLEAAHAGPRQFGQFLFERYWLAVEIVSLLLFVGLVGALFLGKAVRKPPGRQSEEIG